MHVRAGCLSLALAVVAGSAWAHAPRPAPEPPSPTFELHLQCLDEEAHIDDVVLVEVAHGQGRIRIARAMLPAIRADTPDDWRPLLMLSVEDRQIVGGFMIGPLNKSSLAIDRVTGRITMSGLGFEFKGDCQAYMPDNGRKF